MKLKALRNFKGPEGRFAIGQTFEAKADRAKWLIAEGFAAQDEGQAAAPPVPAKRSRRAK